MPSAPSQNSSSSSSSTSTNCKLFAASLTAFPIKVKDYILNKLLQFDQATDFFFETTNTTGSKKKNTSSSATTTKQQRSQRRLIKAAIIAVLILTMIQIFIFDTFSSHSSDHYYHGHQNSHNTMMMHSPKSFATHNDESPLISSSMSLHLNEHHQINNNHNLPSDNEMFDPIPDHLPESFSMQYYYSKSQPPTPWDYVLFFHDDGSSAIEFLHQKSMERRKDKNSKQQQQHARDINDNEEWEHDTDNIAEQQDDALVKCFFNQSRGEVFKPYFDASVDASLIPLPYHSTSPDPVSSITTTTPTKKHRSGNSNKRHYSSNKKKDSLEREATISYRKKLVSPSSPSSVKVPKGSMKNTPPLAPFNSMTLQQRSVQDVSTPFGRLQFSCPDGRVDGGDVAHCKPVRVVEEDQSKKATHQKEKENDQDEQENDSPTRHRKSTTTNHKSIAEVLIPHLDQQSKITINKFLKQVNPFVSATKNGKPFSPKWFLKHQFRHMEFPEYSSNAMFLNPASFKGSGNYLPSSSMNHSSKNYHHHEIKQTITFERKSRTFPSPQTVYLAHNVLPWPGTLRAGNVSLLPRPYASCRIIGESNEFNSLHNKRQQQQLQQQKQQQQAAIANLKNNDDDENNNINNNPDEQQLQQNENGIAAGSYSSGSKAGSANNNNIDNNKLQLGSSSSATIPNTKNDEPTFAAQENNLILNDDDRFVSTSAPPSSARSRSRNSKQQQVPKHIQKQLAEVPSPRDLKKIIFKFPKTSRGPFGCVPPEEVVVDWSPAADALRNETIPRHMRNHIVIRLDGKDAERELIAAIRKREDEKHFEALAAISVSLASSMTKATTTAVSSSGDQNDDKQSSIVIDKETEKKIRNRYPAGYFKSEAEFRKVAIAAMKAAAKEKEASIPNLSSLRKKSSSSSVNSGDSSSTSPTSPVKISSWYFDPGSNRTKIIDLVEYDFLTDLVPNVPCAVSVQSYSLAQHRSRCYSDDHQILNKEMTAQQIAAFALDAKTPSGVMTPMQMINLFGAAQAPPQPPLFFPPKFFAQTAVDYPEVLDLLTYSIEAAGVSSLDLFASSPENHTFCENSRKSGLKSPYWKSVEEEEIERKYDEEEQRKKKLLLEQQRSTTTATTSTTTATEPPTEQQHQQETSTTSTTPSKEQDDEEQGGAENDVNNNNNSNMTLTTPKPKSMFSKGTKPPRTPFTRRPRSSSTSSISSKLPPPVLPNKHLHELSKHAALRCDTGPYMGYTNIVQAFVTCTLLTRLCERPVLEFPMKLHHANFDDLFNLKLITKKLEQRFGVTLRLVTVGGFQAETNVDPDLVFHAPPSHPKLMSSFTKMCQTRPWATVYVGDIWTSRTNIAASDFHSLFLDQILTPSTSILKFANNILYRLGSHTVVETIENRLRREMKEVFEYEEKEGWKKTRRSFAILKKMKKVKSSTSSGQADHKDDDEEDHHHENNEDHQNQDIVTSSVADDPQWLAVHLRFEDDAVRLSGSSRTSPARKAMKLRKFIEEHFPRKRVYYASGTLDKNVSAEFPLRSHQVRQELIRRRKSYIEEYFLKKQQQDRRQRAALLTARISKLFSFSSLIGGKNANADDEDEDDDNIFDDSHNLHHHHGNSHHHQLSWVNKDDFFPRYKLDARRPWKKVFEGKYFNGKPVTVTNATGSAVDIHVLLHAPVAIVAEFSSFGEAVAAARCARGWPVWMYDSEASVHAVDCDDPILFRRSLHEAIRASEWSIRRSFGDSREEFTRYVNGVVKKHQRSQKLLLE